MRQVAVIVVRTRFRIFNERFIVSDNFGDDVALVAGFAGFVAEFGDVFRAVTRCLELFRIGIGIAGNSVKLEF